MTVRLTTGSPRAVFALRFGQELAKAMRARKASSLRLAASTGCSKAAIANWKGGGNLPRVDTALRLSEALDWPRLVEIAREGRTVPCSRCGRGFVNEGGSVAHYCSVACREIAGQMRAPSAGASLAHAIDSLLETREGKQGGVPKAQLAALTAEYRRGDALRVKRIDKLAGHAAALQGGIDAMCAGCEPEGVCRDDACALRAFSPLPMAGGSLRAPLAPRAVPTPETEERRKAAIRAANADRWARPGERERQSAQSAARWARLTEAERRAVGTAISKGRRAG